MPRLPEHREGGGGAIGFCDRHPAGTQEFTAIHAGRKIILDKEDAEIVHKFDLLNL
jgi:hypothetical protein